MSPPPEEAEALEARALEFLLAARLLSYPDQRLAPAAAALAEAGCACPAAAALLQAPLDELRSAYLALFEAGGGRTPLYESEYGRMRAMAKGPELADLAGFYRAFGLRLPEASAERELPDHAAVELEFYGVLLAKQAALLGLGQQEGVAVVREARAAFLTDHLGRLAPALAGQGAARDERYGPVLAWCQALVARECQALGAQPAPLDFFAQEAEPEAVCCGASLLPARPGAGRGPP